LISLTRSLLLPISPLSSLSVHPSPTIVSLRLGWKKGKESVKRRRKAEEKRINNEEDGRNSIN
jgi:hypothetical protein